MFAGAYSQLQPLQGAASLIADEYDWSQLYDLSQRQQCSVPCAAAVYFEDMYVDVDYSLHLAREMPCLKVWVTNEYIHSGLRDDGFRILDR